MINTIKKAILGLAKHEATFKTRQFEATDKAVQQHLEGIIEAFIEGYNQAIITPDLKKMVKDLNTQYDDHHVGFAFEGTGMYVAMQDALPWGKTTHLEEYMNNEGKAHHYIILVGAGFVYARLPWGFRILEKYMRQLDPTLAWIIPDGAGFHQGVFFHQKYISQQAPYPKNLPVYAQEPYDSGIGRAMWWVKGANPQKIKAAIDAFPAERRAYLWHGIGTACSYAGGISAAQLLELKACSGDYVLNLLSGVPLATIMRKQGNNPSKWTDLACETLLQLPCEKVSELMMVCRSAEVNSWDSETNGLEVFVENTTKRLIEKLKTLIHLKTS